MPCYITGVLFATRMWGKGVIISDSPTLLDCVQFVSSGVFAITVGECTSAR